MPCGSPQCSFRRKAWSITSASLIKSSQLFEGAFSTLKLLGCDRFATAWSIFSLHQV